MGSLRKLLAAVWFVAGWATLAAAAPTAIQMDEDEETVAAMWKQYQELGDPRIVDSSGWGKKARAWLAAIERLDGHRRFYAQHAETIGALVGRYSPTARDAYEAKVAIKTAFDGAGITNHQAYHRVESMMNMRERVRGEVAAKLAGDCIAEIETWADKDRLAGAGSVVLPKALDDLRQMLDICPRFTPEDERVNAKLARLRPRVEEIIAHFEDVQKKWLEEQTWQAGASSISSGSPKALAQAAKQWLERSDDWGASRERPMKIVAVTVTKDWFVAERDLLGRPTKWALPIHAALEKPGLGEGVVQVIELSMITTGPQKQPPFEGPWVGGSWLIYKKRVPKS